MTAPVPPLPPLISSVLFIGDASADGESAFAHALAIALVRETRLTLLRAGSSAPEADTDWRRWPGVRATLERWGLLEPGSPRSAVFDRFSVQVKKVDLGDGWSVSRVLDFLEGEPSELLVGVYEPGQGMVGTSRDAAAESVARRSGAMVLFVPSGSPGFVSADDGTLSLRRILVPVAADPNPTLGIEIAGRVARALGSETVEVSVLHVGEAAALDLALPPDDEAVQFRRIQRDGPVLEGILDAAEETHADLITMVTNGRSSLAEMLRGSHTERVLRRVRCPVLSLPEPWSDHL